MNIEALLQHEPLRRREFPVVADQIFLAHAGVAPLTHRAADAMAEYVHAAARDNQEHAAAWARIDETRALAARLIGAGADEISLLGPTSLGLNLVARGIPWCKGDEVIFHGDDYPANVYPWRALEAEGVHVKALCPEQPGVITWEVVEAAITERTRLVALATCHFLSGYRIDIDAIGERLQERGILFCLDAIQSLGAFPLSVKHVDFLAADSHKWLLGPLGAGILYVKKSRQDLLRPQLLGAWNVHSPEFVAQDQIILETGGRRYEPGTLYLAGIIGMEASMELLMEIGIEKIGERLLQLRARLLAGAREKGYQLYIEDWDLGRDAHDRHRSGIVSLFHPGQDSVHTGQRLNAADVRVSLRRNRAGQAFLRCSAHFYNTESEIDRVIGLL
jgi:selenocysteine lyase/cysteine desulfurase